MSAPAQAGQDRQQRGAACYVYGIVPGDVEIARRTQGVGDPPGELRLVREGDIAALVSDVDPSRSLGTPEDLTAHQRLLDATATGAPVLPLRFGAVLSGDEAVAEELLAAHHDEFAEALRELEGQTEYLLKGRYVEQAVLSEILSQNEQAAQLREQIRGQDPDLTRDQRIALGEIISQEITALRDADTAAAAEAVQDFCVASVVRDPTHEEDAVHLALLVKQDKRDALAQAVEELRQDWGGWVELRLLGPLAPYDFVATAQPGG